MVDRNIPDHNAAELRESVRALHKAACRIMQVFNESAGGCPVCGAGNGEHDQGAPCQLLDLSIWASIEAASIGVAVVPADREAANVLRDMQECAARRQRDTSRLMWNRDRDHALATMLILAHALEDPATCSCGDCALRRTCERLRKRLDQEIARAGYLEGTIIGAVELLRNVRNAPGMGAMLISSEASALDNVIARLDAALVKAEEMDG